MIKQSISMNLSSAKTTFSIGIVRWPTFEELKRSGKSGLTLTCVLPPTVSICNPNGSVHNSHLFADHSKASLDARGSKVCTLDTPSESMVNC
uniref:Uncharacterized protein n=1 Tax=Noccaea caerulescens TaxID=107243 RepID=A0A1J3H5Q2_NOCCA